MSSRALFQCGRQAVDLVDFVGLFQVIEKFGQDILIRSGLSNTGVFSKILARWYEHKQKIDTGGLFFEHLLLLTYGAQASIPRDRFFALLGLATPDVRQWISPDYSDATSYRLILTRLTMYYLQFSLKPLRYVNYCKPIDCPSWVVDWTAFNSDVSSFTESLDVRFPRKGSTLSASYRPSFEPSITRSGVYEELSGLLLHGSMVDKVKHAVIFPALETSDPSTFHSFRDRITEWVMQSSLELETNSYRSYERYRLDQEANRRVDRAKTPLSKCLKAAVIDELLRAEIDPYCPQLLTIDTDLDADVLALLQQYEAWEQSSSIDNQVLNQRTTAGNCTDPGNQRDGVSEHVTQFYRNAGYTMIWTEKGYRLRDRLAMKEGDVICWFLQVQVPFVLRSNDNRIPIPSPLTPFDYPLGMRGWYPEPRAHWSLTEWTLIGSFSTKLHTSLTSFYDLRYVPDDSDQKGVFRIC